jgi:predicted nucleic acid-binding Zn ribbon protein
MDPRPLGAVLKEVIARLGLGAHIEAARVVETWAALAGPQINRVTDAVWVREGTLYVKLTSAAWRHALHLQREQWRLQLNKALGKPLIQEIIFR